MVWSIVARPHVAVHEPHARLRRVRAARRSLVGARTPRAAHRRRRGGAARPARRLGAAREVRAGALRRLRPASRVCARRSTTGTSSRSSATPACRSRCGSPRAARVRRASCCSTASRLTLLLTYSRFGVALACLAAAAWVAARPRPRREPRRVSRSAAALGAAAFGIALALPGITSDAQPRSVRAHDGWIFALVVLAGAALVVRGRALPRAARGRARRGARASSASRASPRSRSRSRGSPSASSSPGRIWSEFTNPSQHAVLERTTRLGSAKSNRWTWWQEAWHAFTRHPVGGTGAGTFELTNQMLRTSPVVVDEPHNTPLQFLSETGIVGFLLYLGTAGGALWGAWRARRDPAGLALGIARRRLLRARDRRQGLELRRVVRAAPPRRGRARRAARRRSLRRGGRSSPRRPSPSRSPASTRSPRRGSPTASSRRRRRRADVKRAHSTNPLSVDALLEYAAFVDAQGNLEQAEQALQRRGRPRAGERADVVRARRVLLRAQALAARVRRAEQLVHVRPLRQGRRSACGLLDQARYEGAGFTPPRPQVPRIRTIFEPLSCRGGRPSSGATMRTPASLREPARLLQPARARTSPSTARSRDAARSSAPPMR